MQEGELDYSLFWRRWRFVLAAGSTHEDPRDANRFAQVGELLVDVVLVIGELRLLLL